MLQHLHMQIALKVAKNSNNSREWHK